MKKIYNENGNVRVSYMNRGIYATDGEYTLCPIAEEDRELYVELHRQTNGESTLFLNPYVKDIMWDGVMTGENKVYSIFDANSEYCGSMELPKALMIRHSILRIKALMMRLIANG